MVGFADMRMDWTDIYDTDTLVKDFDFDTKDDNTLIVDVGGARGLDLGRLLNKQPQIPAGHLVLQDQADVAAAAQALVDSRIKCEAHDFFMPQSMQGLF